MLLTAASLALRAVSMVFQIYLSNVVGAAGIGLLQLTMSVGMLAMTAATLGVRVAAMYLSAEEYAHRRPGSGRLAIRCCIGYALILSVTVGAALFHFAPLLAVHWIQDGRAAGALQLFGLFLPVSVCWTILDGYFTATGRIGRLVAVEVLERLLSMALTILMLRYWARSDTARACCAILFGSGAASLLSLLFLGTLYLREQHQPCASGAGSMTWRLLRLAVPVGLNDILRSGLSTMEHLMIPRGLAQSGSDPEQAMAAYGTIHGMVFPVILFPAAVLYALSDLLVPELAGSIAQNHRRRIHHMTDKCLRIGLLFAVAIAGSLFVSARPLAQLLYHSEDAGFYLRIFAPLILILYLDTIVDGMHKGLGQQIYCVRYNTFTSLLDVLLLFFLLPRFGIDGYFFAFTATHAVNFYLSLNRLLKVTGYIPSLQYVCKVLFCALAAAWLAQWLVPETLVCALLYIMSFTFLIALLRVCSREDWRWLFATIQGKKTKVETR